MRRARNAVFLVLYGTVTVLQVGCGRPSEPTRTTLRRGLSGEPATLDPGASGDNFSGQVLQDLFEGLASESSDGAAVPAVASSWDIDLSGTRYTFHIRPNAKWSNGKPVLAENFVNAWRRVVDPKTASPVADDLELISGAKEIIAGKALPETLGVRATDNLTLVVQLDRVAPYFPGILTHTSTFPIFAAERLAASRAADWVSNGAYVLKLWEPGTRIQLQKNSEFWDAGNVAIGSVEYQFSSDENSQYSRYRAGQLDMTDTVPTSALPAIKKNGKSELVIAPYLATAYYGLNLAMGPLSKNENFRKALSLAIDREKITKSLGFGQIPAFSLIPPNVWNYGQQIPVWSTWSNAARESEAKRIFALSGVVSDAFRLHVLVNSNPAIKQTAVQVASMWRDVLGVDTEIVEEEYRVFLESRHDKTRWDVVRLAWIADFNDATNFLDTFRSTSTNNDEAFKEHDFDEILRHASEIADPTHRRELLEEAERSMLDQTPIIPLYHYVSKRLVKPYVIGVAPTPLDRVPSKALSFK